MRLSLLLCLVLFPLLFSTAASATTYYVAPAPAGSDANPGSSAAPWLTLQHAVDAIANSDTILVRTGVYAGCRIGQSGASGAVKTLAAEPGATVVINTPGTANRHNSNLEVENWDAPDGHVYYWVIDGLEVANSAAWGIDIREAQYITVRNCKVHNSAITGIFLAFADYALIENNDSYSNGEHGIYNSNSADYVIIRGNRSYLNYGCGSHNNGDISMGGDGQISYETIEQNVLWENANGGGGSAINCDGVSDSIIRNNLLYNNHATGIALYVGDGAEGSSRNKVYHNTIVAPSDGRWVITIPPSYDIAKTNPVENVIVNNIIYTNHSWRGIITIWGVGALATCDYNVVMDNRFSADDEATILSLSAWQGLGYDTHSLIATPDQLFVNAAANNYHLKLIDPISPAIDAGMLLTDVTNDLENTPRPQATGYDIGCYEIGSTFWDVPPAFWAFNEIEACTASGIVQGYNDNSYRPGLVIKRDQMAAFIARAEAGGDAFVPTGPPIATFTDVATNFWAYNYIEYAVSLEIVQGYASDNTFRPGLQLNRAQMAVFLARADAGGDGLVPAGPPIPSFLDVATNYWAFKYIEYIRSVGITEGYTDNTYRPAGLCKRDQMAVFVARTYGLIP